MLIFFFFFILGPVKMLTGPIKTELLKQKTSIVETCMHCYISDCSLILSRVLFSALICVFCSPGHCLWADRCHKHIPHAKNQYCYSMPQLCSYSHVWHIRKEKWKPTSLISFVLYCWHTSRRHPLRPNSTLHPPPNDCPTVSCCEVFAVDQDRTHTSRWGPQTQSASKPSYCHWSRSK